MKKTKRLVSILLAAAMILSHADLSFAQDHGSHAHEEEPAEQAAEDSSRELELEDLDPSSLGVKKLGETEDTDSEDLDPSALTPDTSLEQTVRVSIFLDDKAAVDAGFDTQGIGTNRSAAAYRSTLKAKQAGLTSRIETVLGHTLDVKWNLTLLTNAISAYVRVKEIPLIARLDGVKKVERERHYEAPAGDGADLPQTANTSANMVGAVNAWYELGYTGAGSKVAIIDTGLDTAHQSVDADAFSHAIELVRQEKDVTLMTQADLNAIPTSELNSKSHNYLNAKIPYAYNYVDGGTRVNHQDSGTNHGSHVAGIAAANRFIKSGTSYVDAAETVKAVGMAPDAQILVMKVFGTSGGAYDSDYFAALEDAIVLGADAANLSLGSASPGWTYDSEYQTILNSFAGNQVNNHMVVSISAGNSDAFDDHTAHKLYAEDAFFHTGGSPGTFINSMGTAAAQNTLTEGMPLVFNGSQQVFYTEDTEGEDGAYGNPAISTITGTYDYVYIDARGEAADYAAVNGAVSLSGKIVAVNRGDISFSEKANNAKSYSPKAVIIANNAEGVIHMNLADYTGTFPVVAITLKDADLIRENSTAHTAGDITYYTGRVQVTTTEVSSVTPREEAEITSFSSWGVPGSLLMKPEITAPGGDIYSINGTSSASSDSNTGTTSYVSYSGTSMAAPHIAGLSAILMQYLKEQTPANEDLMSGYDLRAVAQSLLMSTATPMASSGAYLPILQQGAGLAEVSKAIEARSVVMMDEAYLTSRTNAAADGKVKVELGDDPEKKGEYRFSFTVYNISDQTLTFELGTDLFTQAVNGDTLSHKTTLLPPGGDSYTWNGEGGVISDAGHDVDLDGVTDADDAQALLDYITGKLDEQEDQYDFDAGDMDGDEIITSYDAYLLLNWEPETAAPADGYTVAPHGKAKVNVSILLTAAQRAALEKEGGAYLEGFLYVTCVSASKEGESFSHEHAIPILGYYGSWTDASMFDTNSYTENLYGNEQLNYSGASAENTNLMQITADGTLTKFSGNPYMVEAAFPEERLAIRSDAKISSFAYNLIRPAAGTGFAVCKLDADGGVDRVVAASLTGTEVLGSWYHVNNAAWQNTSTKTYSVNKALNEYSGLADGDRVRIGFYAVPEYNAMLKSSDLTAADAGILTESMFRSILTGGVLGKGAYVGFDFTIDDIAPQILSAELSGSTLSVTAQDDKSIAYIAVMTLDGATVYAKAAPGSREYTVSFDASAAIADADGYVAAFVGDYAGNETAVAVKVNDNTSGTDPYTVTGISLNQTSLDLYKGASADLTAKIAPVTAEDQKVNWTSSNSSVASVDGNGHVTAVAGGSAVITAASNANSAITAACSVKVTSVNKALNGIIWDEEGGVYFSSFNADSLPAWTKLHGSKQSAELQNAYMATSSTLYASTNDLQTSTLYTVNRSSYALTEFGENYLPAFGMARASTRYTDYYVYAFAKYLVFGNLTPVEDEEGTFSGLPYGLIDLSETSVGDAYAAAVCARSIGTTSSSYYFLDEAGKIWQVSMTISSSVSFGTPTLVCDTGISAGVQYNSIYYDGTNLYWTHLDGDTAELIILANANSAANRKLYHAGNFGADVWPAVGLYVNGSAAPAAAGDEAEEAGSPADLGGLKVLASRDELMTAEIRARFAAEAEKAAGKLKQTPAEEPAVPEESSAAPEDPAETVPAETADADPVETEDAGTAVPEEATAAPAEETEAEVSEEAAGEESPEPQLPSEEETSADKPSAEDPAFSGGLNLARAGVRPKQAGGEAADLNAAAADDDAEPGTLKLVLYEETASHNGFYSVIYDPETMTFASLSGKAGHFAFRDDAEKGVFSFAFADTKPAAAGEGIAEIVFALNSCDDTDLEVITLERNEETELNEITELPVSGAGHIWPAPTYEWAADNSTVTAKRTCSRCGEEETETVNTTREETAPTCTEAGTVTFTAVFANPAFAVQTKTAEIPAAGHTPVTDPAVEPTCTEPGKTEGKKCSVCGEILVPQEEIPALGHDWGEPAWTWTGDDSVYTAASAVFTCSHDGSHKETVPAVLTSTMHDASCETGGDVTYTAAVTFEGKTYTDIKKVTIPPTDHKPVTDPAVAPTCTETGLTEGSHCSVCGEVIKAQEVVPAFGHDWTFTGFVWTVNNTDGYSGAEAHYRCERDASHEDSMEAHFTVERTEPTETAEGRIVYTAWITAEESLDGEAHEETKIVTLPAVPVTYELNKTSIRLAVGSSEQLQLIGSDGSVGTGTWTSDDPSGASVDENGLVTAHKYRTAPVTIHVTMENGYEADCEVRTLFWDVNGSPDKNDPDYQYYFTAVYWGADHEPAITKGYDLEYFGVGQPCERKDFILFLYRLAGQPSVTAAEVREIRNTFSDLAASELKEIFLKAIAWGYSAKDPDKRIINGYTSGELAGQFGYDRTITRREAILMIWRYAGRPEAAENALFKSFTDVFGADGKYSTKYGKAYYSAASDTYQSIRWAAATGISNGYRQQTDLLTEQGLTAPCYGCKLECLREDMIVFLYRFAEKFGE